jgi:hypothetical protein
MDETKYYILTKSDEPLSAPDDAKCHSRAGYSKLDDAVDNFILDCRNLDVGCVQLWDGKYETGRLYL